MVDKNGKTLYDVSTELWESLQQDIRYLDIESQEQVQLGFIQMVEAHQTQFRKSGDFYIIHPTAICSLLAKMQLDPSTLIAALLHDVPEDTVVSLRDLSKTFSQEVVFLVSGVTKLSVIKYKGEDRYAENLRRMFVAMSQDIRVIFIKLADRIHNLSTLESLPDHKAQRIALESLEIYAPIAERLGMGKFQDTIENLSFPYAYPKEYEALNHVLHSQYERQEQVIKTLVTKVSDSFTQDNLQTQKIYGRAKKYYSIYKKIHTFGKTLDTLYDLFALRVITESIDECYQVFSQVQRIFNPLDERVKDYIAHPKSNGYQSIHTTVQDIDTGLIFEIQIRTREMHEYCEYGIASHWAYKQSTHMKQSQFVDSQRFRWIEDLVNLGKEPLSEEEYLQYVKLDLFQDTIFVMTPKNDVISLKDGATALDFAFHIHQSIGSHASLAKVNGAPVKLDTALQNGDVVEILTDKRQKPSQAWLHMVKTPSAARIIRNLLRKQGKKV